MLSEELRFPTGRFEKPEKFDSNKVEEWLKTIEEIPSKIITTAGHLPSEQLGWKYRPEGWNVKQVVHHLADSHMNCLIRLKLTLTEDSPIIKPYKENLWAELPDDNEGNLSPSIQILKGVHHKMVKVWSSIEAKDWTKFYVNPEYNSKFSMYEALALYAWHCNHHLAHIEQAILSKGKYN